MEPIVELVWSYLVSSNIGNVQVFLWTGREKGKGFFSPCAFVRHRGGRAKLEWKDFPFGPAKRVRRGRIGMEGLWTSAGAWRKNLHKANC